MAILALVDFFILIIKVTQIDSSINRTRNENLIVKDSQCSDSCRMFLDKFLFYSKLQINYHNSSVGQTNCQILSFFFPSLISHTCNLVRQFKGSCWSLYVVFHFLKEFLGSFDSFFVFTFLLSDSLYQVCKRFLLLCCLFCIDTSLSDYFNEVVMTEILEDCLFRWLLDVMD